MRCYGQALLLIVFLRTTLYQTSGFQRKCVIANILVYCLTFFDIGQDQIYTLQILIFCRPICDFINQCFALVRWTKIVMFKKDCWCWPVWIVVHKSSCAQCISTILFLVFWNCCRVECSGCFFYHFGASWFSFW